MAITVVNIIWNLNFSRLFFDHSIAIILTTCNAIRKWHWFLLLHFKWFFNIFHERFFPLSFSWDSNQFIIIARCKCAWVGILSFWRTECKHYTYKMTQFIQHTNSIQWTWCWNEPKQWFVSYCRHLILIRKKKEKKKEI